MNRNASNPYIAGSPLRDAYGFFGRQDILDWVLSELSNVYTNALVLFGQRRVGKTTLLLQLQRYLPADKFFPVYFDLQEHSRNHLGRLLADLADEVASRLEMNEHSPEKFDDQGKYFRSVFLPDLYNQLSPGCRPVFLLDEFDVLEQEDENLLGEMVASRALFPFLRKVMNEDIRSAFVFAVGRRTEDLRVDFNQTFKTSLTKEIWVLDRADAENLIRQAEVNGTLKFSQQAVDYILRLTNNHAYLTQLICQRIWQRSYQSKPTEIPVIDVDDVIDTIPETLEAGEHALIWLWSGLSPAEKIYAAALAEISNEGKAIQEDQVIKVLAEHAARLRRREVELAPQDLVSRHVLNPIGKREYLFAVELFRQWVKKKHSLREVADEIDRVDPLAERLFQIGLDFHKKREWNEAVRFFRDALQQNPNHLRANILLGETYLIQGLLEQAVDQLETAYTLDSYESQYPLARALIANGKAKEKDKLEQEALRSYERALEVSPNERSAQDARKVILERQGEAALERGDLEVALGLFEKTGNTDKVDQVKQAYTKLSLLKLETAANELAAQGNWKQAIPLYEELIQNAQEESRAKWQSALLLSLEEEKLGDLFTLGLGALASGNWEQAKRAFAEIIYVRPDYQKDNKSAIKLLEQAITGRKPVNLGAAVQQMVFRPVVATLIITVVVLVAVYFESILQDTPSTQAPSPTATLSATPNVDNATPLPNPTIEVPIASIAGNEDFDALTSSNYLASGNYSVAEGILKLEDPIVTGDPWIDGSAFFHSNFSVDIGNGYITLFRIREPGTEFLFVLEDGDFESPLYRAFWFESGRSVSIWIGKKRLYSQNLPDLIKQDTWYYLLIRPYATDVDIRIWEKDNSQNDFMMKFHTASQTVWNTDNLSFNVNLPEGVMEIDEVQEVTFLVNSNETIHSSSIATPPSSQHEILEFTDSMGVQMVLVPQGEFWMGSTHGEPDELPLQKVFLSDFYIDKFEVTNERYKSCVDAGECQVPKDVSAGPYKYYYDDPAFANYPVVYVDWNMAKAYCEWRGASLPTEAQWEKAAKGSSLTMFFPWGMGENISKANFNFAVGGTTPVGTYLGGKSTYGTYDMAGNVWEWVNDWWGNYLELDTIQRDPSGPLDGTKKVLRGGAWNSGSYAVRLSYRASHRTSNSISNLGFRCANTPENLNIGPATSTNTVTSTPTQGLAILVIRHNFTVKQSIYIDGVLVASDVEPGQSIQTSVSFGTHEIYTCPGQTCDPSDGGRVINVTTSPQEIRLGQS